MVLRSRFERSGASQVEGAGAKRILSIVVGIRGRGECGTSWGAVFAPHGRHLCAMATRQGERVVGIVGGRIVVLV